MDDRFAIGAAVRLALTIAWRRMPAFLAISTVAHALAAAANAGLFAALGPDRGAYLMLVAPILPVAASSAVLTHAAIAGARAPGARSWASIGPGLRRWPAVFVADVAYDLMLVVGCILLLAPGLVVASRFMPATGAIVAGRSGPWKAFPVAARLSRGARWKLAALAGAYALLWAVVGYLSVLGYIVVSSVLRWSSEEDPGFLALFAFEVPGLLKHVAVVPIAAVIYAELVRLREGAPAEATAEVFE